MLHLTLTVNAEEMNAIETKYKGYRFRSRLEARVAVLLDGLGADWEYEPEGFILDNGLWYLPDFKVKNIYLRNQKTPTMIWIEVKGEMTDLDAKKLNSFCEKDKYQKPQNPLFIMGKILDEDEIVENANCLFDKFSMKNKKWPDMFNFSTVDGDYYEAILAKYKDGSLRIVGPSHDYWDFVDLPQTAKAYEIARQARFEFGEKPNFSGSYHKD